MQLKKVVIFEKNNKKTYIKSCPCIQLMYGESKAFRAVFQKRMHISKFCTIFL